MARDPVGQQAMHGCEVARIEPFAAIVVEPVGAALRQHGDGLAAVLAEGILLGKGQLRRLRRKGGREAAKASSGAGKGDRRRLDIGMRGNVSEQRIARRRRGASAAGSSMRGKGVGTRFRRVGSWKFPAGQDSAGADRSWSPDPWLAALARLLLRCKDSRTHR